MPFVLYDRIANLYFCQRREEWSPDPKDAHQFVTRERADGGVLVWKEIHQRDLEVIPFEIACENAERHCS